MSAKTRWWWRWQLDDRDRGRATYFCGKVNEVTVNLPNFEQAHALAKAIEAQVKATRCDARYWPLQDIMRIEP